jgi:hypothetical protein
MRVDAAAHVNALVMGDEQLFQGNDSSDIQP